MNNSDVTYYVIHIPTRGLDITDASPVGIVRIEEGREYEIVVPEELSTEDPHAEILIHTPISKADFDMYKSFDLFPEFQVNYLGFIERWFHDYKFSAMDNVLIGIFTLLNLPIMIYRNNTIVFVTLVLLWSFVFLTFFARMKAHKRAVKEKLGVRHIVLENIHGL